jgi:hypothetical protein
MELGVVARRACHIFQKGLEPAVAQISQRGEIESRTQKRVSAAVTGIHSAQHAAKIFRNLDEAVRKRTIPEIESEAIAATLIEQFADFDVREGISKASTNVNIRKVIEETDIIEVKRDSTVYNKTFLLQSHRSFYD